MQRKIIKIGDSVGVTIPKTVRESLGIKRGDPVTVEKTADGFTVNKADTGTRLDPEVVAWTDSFIAENRELLDKLSDA